MKSKGGGCSRWEDRERVSDFSLEMQTIRPSAVFEARRRTGLRGEGFAWVPDL